MDPPRRPGEEPSAATGLLGRRSKNRNKKGLALAAEATKPGTLSGASAVDLLRAPAPPVPSRPQPVQVAGSSRSKRSSVVSLESDSTSPQLPATPSLSSSSTSSRSYHNQLNEQLATLELGVEFRIDLRNEDLEVLDELGSGNSGTVSRVLHVPTKAVMAKKVRRRPRCLLETYADDCTPAGRAHRDVRQHAQADSSRVADHARLLFAVYRVVLWRVPARSAHLHVHGVHGQGVRLRRGPVRRSRQV